MTRKTLARLLFAGSALLLCLFLSLLLWDTLAGQTDQPPLVVHAGASLRTSLEQIVRAYEKETGSKVEVRYGGSQTVLTNLQVTGQGDLFVPGDESYIQLADKNGLLAEVFPLARMQAVVLLSQNFPGEIKNFAGLLAPNIKVAQSNPDAAALGKLTRAELTGAKLWEDLKARTTSGGVFTGNVVEAANAVQLGSADAGIVWDVVAAQFPKLSTVRLPELNGITARVHLAVVKNTKQPTEALRFARFAAASDRGLDMLRQTGFSEIEPGDVYARSPELVLYGGAMLRPAIDDTINDFEKREGIKVKRIYNGCGILVSQMKTGSYPDVYFACDTQFMRQVQDAFDQPAVISSNQLVIAVPRGNPKDLMELKDLGKGKLRVGVGHEQQCALGAITKESFIRTGVYAGVMKNVVVQSPTGDFLVNQLRTGSLDAVVAYQSNTTPYDDIEAISVTGIPCAAPQQPVAISKTSKYPNLSRRLLQALQSPESRERFRKFGFGWEWQKTPASQAKKEK